MFVCFPARKKLFFPLNTVNCVVVVSVSVCVYACVFVSVNAKLLLFKHNFTQGIMSFALSLICILCVLMCVTVFQGVYRVQTYCVFEQKFFVFFFYHFPFT